MIAFKTVSALDQWHDLHPKLRQVVLDLHDTIWPLDIPFVVTRIADYDPNQKTTIHTDGPPYRAIDLRTVGHFQDSAALQLESQINARWKYGDDVHNCALYHVGSAPHLHLQVRDETHIFTAKTA